MKGELNRGIGAQSQALMQQAMEAGMSAAGDQWSHEQDELTRAKLEGMTDLTPKQEETLSEIKGREYADLDFRAKTGEELTPEQRLKLETYQRRDAEARAQQKVAYDAYIQSQVDKHKAEAAQAEEEGRTKDAAIAVKRRAAEEVAKKPEPGTLPAVASGRPLTSRTVAAALDEIDRQKSAKDIEKANPFLSAQGLADKCKEEGARLREGEYRHLMDRCVAEGATLDADTWTYLQGQRSRENWDKSYIYCETTKGLIAVPVDRLEQSRPHQLGQALDDIAEAYDGSKLQSGVRTISDGIGTVFHEFGKALCMPTDVDSADELRLFGKMYDETPGPMQYVGEKLHQGAQKGFEFAGASRHSAEILATATLDVVNIATAATGAKAALRPVATSAGAALETTLQHGVDVAKRVEFKVQAGTMSANGLGGVDIRLRPKVEAPTVAASKATGAAAEWTQPMRVAPKVEFTAPSAGMRAPVSHYEPVVRPTVSVHVDTVPSYPVRPMVAEPLITQTHPAQPRASSAPRSATAVESGVIGALEKLVYEDVAYPSTKVQTVQSRSGTQGTHTTSAATSHEYIPTYKNGTYVAAKYHVHQRPDKSPAPLYGQKSLDNAIEVIDKKGVKTEGVLVSVNNDGSIVIFRDKSKKPGPPQYHGYVTDYKEILTRHNDIKQTLEIAGCFTKKGRFIKGTE